MSSLFKIPGISLKSFFLGFASGFLGGLISPKLGKSYYVFCAGQAEHMQNFFTTGGDLPLMVIIYLRNFAIASLIAVLPLMLISHTLAYRKRHPFKSGDFHQKLTGEIRLTLTIYSVSILFAYGFAVFGLFLASVFAENSFQGLLRWSLYLVPHGILETLCMISAASVGIVIRDNWLKTFDTKFQYTWKRLPKRCCVSYLVFLSTVLFFAAFLEVYVSRGLNEFVHEAIRLYFNLSCL